MIYDTKYGIQDLYTLLRIQNTGSLHTIKDTGYRTQGKCTLAKSVTKRINYIQNEKDAKCKVKQTRFNRFQNTKQ